MNYGKVCHNNKQTGFSEYSMQRCVDERNGVGGAIRCNRSALRSTIRAVYKSGVLKPCEVERRIRLLNDYYSEAYALPMIVHSLSASTHQMPQVCAMPCWKGCACEKKDKSYGLIEWQSKV